MVSFTVEEKSDEELAPKVEELNKKINEKYGLENKVENISIVHSPKVRLRDIICPNIWPVGICTTLVFVYAMIRYRKLGAFRTLGKYIVGVLGIELLYLSFNCSYKITNKSTSNTSRITTIYISNNNCNSKERNKIRET